MCRQYKFIMHLVKEITQIKKRNRCEYSATYLKIAQFLISKHIIYVFREWTINNDYMMSLPIVFMVIKRKRHGVCDLMTILRQKIRESRLPYFKV